ncbi:MAG: chloride channel protein [Candidatus Limnocylindrales bacterium]
METTAGGTRAPGFWRLLGYAALLGIVGVVAGLVFISITNLGARWYGESGTGWFEGHPWWILVAAAAGVLVGLLRRYLHMPDQVPGLIEDLRLEHVDRRAVPSIVAVSAVSLMGGASLGPEVALGQMGGGGADLIASRGKLHEDETKALTLAGMAGAFGGLFSSPFLASFLVLEVSRTALRRFERAFFGSLVASSVSFGLTFAIAGSIFIGVYEVPSYGYADWHLLAGVGLGLLAALIVVLLGVVGAVAKSFFARLQGPAILKPIIGGLLFGLVGVALPLTNFTGSDQLAVVVEEADDLGALLLIATLLGKMVAFVVSTASGFIGGPIFPVLFMGGTAGTIVHELLPGIPLGLAFSCMLAAVPGSVVAAPFSMVLLAALFTQVGALETAPILVAVATASLTVAGIRAERARRAEAGNQVVTQ